MLTLCFEFFKAGLFAVGGGLATLPFLKRMSEKYDFFTTKQLMDMIAISESTPGPIGINVATFAGYEYNGISGALAAVISLILPSIVIIILISDCLDKFKENIYVKRLFYVLRPAGAGLISAAITPVFFMSIAKNGTVHDFSDINLFSLMFFTLFSLAAFKFKKIHPIVFIIAGALLGVIFKI